MHTTACSVQLATCQFPWCDSVFPTLVDFCLRWYHSTLVSRGYTACLRPKASPSDLLPDDAREPKTLSKVLDATGCDLLALIGHDGLLACHVCAAPRNRSLQAPQIPTPTISRYYFLSLSLSSSDPTSSLATALQLPPSLYSASPSYCFPSTLIPTYLFIPIELPMLISIPLLYNPSAWP